MVAMPLVWWYFLRRAKKDPAYGENWDERRGVCPQGPFDIWIHTVSIGEFRSAEPAIRLLLANNFRILISHMTPAGREASQSALKNEIEQGRIAVCYSPVDRATYWRRFLRRATPKLAIVFEMEFWPGMAEGLSKAKVPLWYVNSQVPSKSFSRAKQLSVWLGDHPISRANRVLAKSERMADRFKEIGASEVHVIGETRFDIAAPKNHLDAGRSLRTSLGDRPVYCFASVVAGEEVTYADALIELAADPEKPFFIWVPRAPELFEATYDLLTARGLKVVRRSQAFDRELNQSKSVESADVFLGDSFGEMFFYLSCANVVSVGGGFVEKGAHNVIEPLALGKPVVTGPHVWTIEYPGVEAEEAGVLVICKKGHGLASCLSSLKSAGAEPAKKFHSDYAGASERLVDAIIAELGSVRL